MKERPILFSSPMVRAILSGAKTQTRRTVKLAKDGSLPVAPCPYGEPSDRLWVKERLRESEYVDNVARTSCLPNGGTVGFLEFFADSARIPCPSHVVPFDHQPWAPWQWRRPSLPSIHMPRWASRITLEVTGVRVERLQDISKADACAEGVTPFPDDPGGDCWTDGKHKTAFNYLWNEINGWEPNAWSANPWVWVVEFRRVT